MKALRLTEKLDASVLIPFESLTYPRDPKAYFAGRKLGGLPFRESVQYLTCQQIQRGDPVESLAYYHWTLEKLERFGRPFEDFLFKPSKGCNVDPARQAEITAMDQAARHAALAEASTRAFLDLCCAVTTSWNPSASTRPIAAR